MTKILMGRAGEALHEFTLEDIKRGAVRESGIFPELYKSAWPAMTAGVLVSGVTRKLDEDRAAVSFGGFDFPVNLPPALLPKALEDYKEDAETQSQIARMKAHVGFVGPVRQHISHLKPDDAKKFKAQIARRAGVLDLRYLLAEADDRNLILAEAYREPAYGTLRDHWNAQVREIFNPEHPLPGKRVKEVDSARYGVANSVYIQQTVARALAQSGRNIPQECRMDTTKFWQVVEPGRLPLPEQGLIVQAIGQPLRQREFTDKDEEAIRRGKILTYDDFNLADHPDVAEGTTFAQLKRKSPQHPFLVEVHSPGAAMTASLHAFGVHKLGKDSARRPRQISPHKPRTVISSVSGITEPPAPDVVRSKLAFPNNMGLSRENGGITDLRKLEIMAYSGQAFVVQDPDQFPARAGEKLTQREVKLLRRLETDLIYAYLATMSTQAGAPNHIGRSHMVEMSYWQKRGLWHSDLCNLGLTGDIETEAYRTYRNGRQLMRGLEDWDQATYQHQVNTPGNDFLSERQIKRILGRQDLGYVVSGYGSASSFIDAAYKVPCEFFNRLSRYNGVFQVNGGGTRGSMRGMNIGALDAIKAGYKVDVLGIRSITDVSPLEGGIEDFINEQGYRPVQGRDPRYVHYANGQMHILNLSRLLQRQAPILGLSHISTLFPGGKGTIVEALITMLNNARVQIYGEGIRSKFSLNSERVPLLIFDHDFEYLGQQRQVFDTFLKPYRNDLDFLGIHVLTGPHQIDRGIDFVLRHSESMGHKLTLQTPHVPSCHTPAYAP
jgi:predicted Rossmann-fold nucleotide-binding protein